MVAIVGAACSGASIAVANNVAVPNGVVTTATLRRPVPSSPSARTQSAAAIVTLLTAAHGRHAGLVRGGAGSRARGLYQPGNQVRATWRARLEEVGADAAMVAGDRELGFTPPLLKAARERGHLEGVVGRLETPGAVEDGGRHGVTPAIGETGDGLDDPRAFVGEKRLLPWI